MAKQTGKCHICGSWGPLTFEHIPPKSAGNEPYGQELDISHFLQTDPKAPLSSIRRRNLPRGSGAFVLCGSCNNNTGNWYAPAYAEWAYQGERHRRGLGNTNSLALPFRILPARVFKQILAIFAASCSPNMFEKNPFLRKLVLDRNNQGMPDDLRLYCYIVHPESHYSRRSGVVGIIEGSSIHTLAEFAFRPFGYLLTFGGTPPPDHGLFDLTFFAHHSYHDYRDLHLPIPIRSVESYLPADFRTKNEWDQTNQGSGRMGEK